MSTIAAMTLNHRIKNHDKQKERRVLNEKGIKCLKKRNIQFPVGVAKLFNIVRKIFT